MYAVSTIVFYSYFGLLQLTESSLFDVNYYNIAHLCFRSCVAFGEKERILGVAAKNQMVTNRKNSVWGFKKLLGRPFNDPQVQQERPKLSYDVVEGPDGSTGIQVLLDLQLIKTPCWQLTNK